MDIISFLQDRISQAYTEQIWVVSILGIYYTFLITKGDEISKFIKAIFLKISIWLFAVIGLRVQEVADIIFNQ